MGLSAQTVSWDWLRNGFVEVDGKGSSTDVGRAERAVLGGVRAVKSCLFHRGASPAQPVCSDVGNFLSKFSPGGGEEPSMRTDITAAPSFTNLRAFSTPGKRVRIIP